MQDIKRRDAATWALSSCLSLLAACGGGESAQAYAGTSPAPETAPPPPAPAAPPVWNVAQILSFVSGNAATLLLSDTLPTGVVRGGRFSVNAAGVPLPGGTTLSQSGALTVSAATAVSATAGVIFEYSEP